MAAAQLREPLYDDKVVDFLFDKAEITERAVSREELEAAIEADEDGHVHGPGCGHDHDHDHGDKPKAKKAAAKKKDVTADETVKASAEEKPDKKAPAKNRSEARRVGKECVRKWRYRWSRYHTKKKNKHNRIETKKQTE